MSATRSDPRRVLVTGAGGMVGLGVIRHIRARYPEIRLVGTDINPQHPGQHYCHSCHHVPFSLDPAYRKRLLEICALERIELVIPTTDYEATLVAEWRHDLPPAVANPPRLARCFLDKLLSYRELEAHGIPFARSWLPSEHPAGAGPTVVKPRDGRGSRDVHIEPADPAGFDDGFVVQELLGGREITSAVWITRAGELLGSISLERELVRGLTRRCHVIREVDEAVAAIGTGLAGLGARGPINVQSKVAASGRVTPFEINGRYSGTVSIRSHFGFEDVRWGIEEYLLGIAPSPPSIRPGRAERLLLDVITPDDPNIPSFVF